MLEQPKLEQIKNGWAALGKGWAVHGHTQEEALEEFRKAQIRHQEIDSQITPNRNYSQN